MVGNSKELDSTGQGSTLIVRNVSAETKDQLRQLARHRYGRLNASQCVRDLISDAVRRELPSSTPIPVGEGMRRFQLSIPATAFDEMEQRAEARFTKPHLYIANLIYRDIGIPQLHADEIEVLRNSNYQLAKIGTNVNQIAKVFNQFVTSYQGQEKLPPVAREMDKLGKAIREHLEKVTALLERGSAIEAQKPRRGGKPPEKNKKRGAAKTKFSPKRK